LGGVAATSEFVCFSDRSLDDTSDIFTCVKADSGTKVWSISNPGVGNLDYGNSPRATPVIAGDRVYLFGAFGYLICAELKSGKVLWEMDLRIEFEPEDKPKWGACSTPLLVDGKVIVNPGAKDASLAALDAKTGKVVWKSPGQPAGYGSLIVATLGGVEQIVGHDADSLNGWDPKTGKRLWKVVPVNPNDFNVPTPIVWKDHLVVSTENNGTRLFRFGKDGLIDAKPVATHRKLAPDTHTPVLVGDRIIGVWRRLYSLDLKAGLKESYENNDQAYTKYCAVVSDGQRVLVITMEGELILIDGTADEYEEIGRLKVLDKEKGLYSHPAFVGRRIYLRGSTALTALDFPE
jgi:outer membrane protein assembly factor BamB